MIVFSYPCIKISNLQNRQGFCSFVLQNQKKTIMEEKIIQALEKGGAMRPGDIATAAGVSKDDVTKAIKKLVAEGKVWSPKRCFYDIKK